MLQGMLDYLVSEEAAELRKHFVFRIIPMLNVDGVIYGNQRCSLLGVDLNRRWVSPNVFLHPTIYYAKQLIRHMHNERRVLMYCDLHGHSRKQNAFFYACTYKNYEHEGRIKNAQLRMIPLLCCHKSPSFFSFQDCRFRIEKYKESTARVVIFRDFNIMNAFTLEVSFFGKEPEPPPSQEGENGEETQRSLPITSRQTHQGTHFTLEDLKIIGQTLPQVLNNYLPREQTKLEMLSGKILEIFYEEFVKLIPPYILKREEERKRQLIGLQAVQEAATYERDSLMSQQYYQNAYNFPLGTHMHYFNKSPTVIGNQIRMPLAASPRITAGAVNPSSNLQATHAQGTLVRMQTLKKSHRASVNSAAATMNLELNQQQLSTVIKQKTQKVKDNQPVALQSTPGMANQIVGGGGISTNPATKRTKEPAVGNNTTGKKHKKQKRGSGTGGGPGQCADSGAGNTGATGTGTETDTFSQIIQIHKNHEELLDFEQFIKGAKLQLSKQHDMIDEEDEENEMDSDSSADSDESSKNLIVEQGLQQMNSKAQAALQHKKGVQKKSMPLGGSSSKRQNGEGGEDMFRTVDGKRKQKRQNGASSMLAPRQQHVQALENFKFGPISNKNYFSSSQSDSRQNLRFVNKTYIKNRGGDLAVDLQFDKIPHRASKSPKNAGDTIEDLQIEEQEQEQDQNSIQEEEEDDDDDVAIINDHNKDQEDGQQQKNAPSQTGFGSYFTQVVTATGQDLKQRQHKFEPRTNKLHQQNSILPLYENAQYHQNRLNSVTNSQDKGGGQSFSHLTNTSSTNTNNNSIANTGGIVGIGVVPPSIIYRNMKSNGNPFSFRHAHQRQLYEPYNDDKLVINPRTSLGNHPQTQKPQAPKNTLRPNTQLQDGGDPYNNVSAGEPPESKSSNLHPMISNIEQLCRKVKETAMNKQRQHGGISALGHLNQRPLGGGLVIAHTVQENSNHFHKESLNDNEIASQVHNYSSKTDQSSRQTSGSAINNSAVLDPNLHGALQRISFKELLESSRQQRVIVGGGGSGSATGTLKNQNPMTNGLVSMLTNTYQQRLQQQQQQVQAFLNIGGTSVGIGASQIGSNLQSVDQQQQLQLQTEYQDDKPLIASSLSGSTSLEHNLFQFGTSSNPQQLQQQQQYTNSSVTAQGSLQNTFREQQQDHHLTTPNIVIVNKKNMGAGIQTGSTNVSRGTPGPVESSKIRHLKQQLVANKQSVIIIGEDYSEVPNGLKAEDFFIKVSQTVGTPQKRLKMIQQAEALKELNKPLSNAPLVFFKQWNNQQIPNNIYTTQRQYAGGSKPTSSFTQHSALKTSSVGVGGGFVRKGPSLLQSDDKKSALGKKSALK